MLKCLTVFFLCLSIEAAQAQVIDSLGASALGKMLDAQDFQGVGQMNSALNKVQLQQDLNELNMQIQTTFIHNYTGLNKEVLNFSGLKNVNWLVEAVSASEYFVQLDGVDGVICEYLRFNGGAKRIEISNGNCNEKGNMIRLYY